MKMCRSYILLVLCMQIIVDAKTEFPPYIKLCHRNDPNINDCLKENTELIRPHLKDGIKLMKIPAVDPMYLPRITLSLNNFNASYINLQIYDATKYVIKNLSLDIDKRVLNLNVYFPSLALFADYEINGKLLVLELSGHGKTSANISDLSAIGEIRAEVYEKDKKSFLNFTDYKLKLEIGNAHVYFDNLFGSNTQLTETTNEVINANIKDFIGELQPIFEETVASFIFSVTERIFKMYSIDELFPE